MQTAAQLPSIFQFGKGEQSHKEDTFHRIHSRSEVRSPELKIVIALGP